MSHDRRCHCEACVQKELQLLRRLAELVELFRLDKEPGFERIYRTVREWQRFTEGERG